MNITYTQNGDYLSGSLFVSNYFIIGTGYIDLTGGLHLELIHGGAGLGDVELVAVLARHSYDLLFVFIFLRSGLAGYRSHSLTRIHGSMRIFRR